MRTNKYNVYFLNSENKQIRKTNLSRLQAIEQYYNYINNFNIAEKDIIIYCSTRDFYVKGQGMRNSFLEDFLNKNSNLGKMYHDENALLLENTLRGLKFRQHNGKICYIKNNNIEYINF